MVGKKPKRNLTVRLEGEDREWLEAEAARQVRSVANLIYWILAEYRKSHEGIAVHGGGEYKS
jgi:hypothetical protein